MPASLLTGTKVIAAAFVDAGAAPGATIAFFKSRSPVVKAAMPLLTALATEKMGAIKSQIDSLTKALADGTLTKEQASELMGSLSSQIWDAESDVRTVAKQMGVTIPDSPTPEVPPMDAILKQLEDMDEKGRTELLAKIFEAHPPEDSAEVTKLRTDLETETAKAVDLQKQIDDAKPEPDPMAGLPEEFTKRMKDTEDQLAAEVAKRRTTEFLAKAKTFDVGIEHDKLGGYLETLEGTLDAAGYAEFEKMLTGVSEARSKAAEQLTKESGRTTTEVGDAGEKLATLAKSRRDSNPNITYEAAYDQVSLENPELFQLAKEGE